MMNLYSGTTCPFSQRCRIVLYEKRMDFQIIDVDMYNKPEDIAVMNPYNRLPVLVERDLILYEANIINEYIDERFPHPQLMPADPVMRARARLFLFQFEVELFPTSRRSKTATRSSRTALASMLPTSSRRWRRCLPNRSTCWATSSRCSTWRSARSCGGSTTTA